MKATELGQLISNLGKALLTDENSFESIAKQAASNISVDDLPYLRSKLHLPPPVHQDINENELGLGEWLSICQYAIFELVYQLDIRGLGFLKSIAFGEYDWTQATALEVICRLYVDSKAPTDTIEEIDIRLGNMRYETHLYFAQALIRRRERDPAFNNIIKQIRNTDFQLAIRELYPSEAMTRDELIKLGRKIVDADGDEEEIQHLMELFDKNVPYPNGSNLFYYPENFNARNDDQFEYEPSVEEVVDKCLSYKPIHL